MSEENGTTTRIPALKCVRCEHEWHPRSVCLPLTCPKCQSRNWYRPETSKPKQE